MAEEQVTPPVVDAAPAPEGKPSQDDCTMAMLAHLLGGLLGFLVPLIIWLIKKDHSKFVADQGAEALNFQLTLLIGYAIATVISIVTCGFGSILYLVLWPLGVVFGILGGMKAKDGVLYRYPFCIRMVK